MSKTNSGRRQSPVGELFERLGSTPRSRSTRAAALFRRLRDGKGDRSEFDELAGRFGLADGADATPR
ncbi:MAG: hypothetical protein GC152_07245 [Alphaproteobacteria bacterium]|nr:hypothetical protein [Alphaproteobacteria bacterium]